MKIATFLEETVGLNAHTWWRCTTTVTTSNLRFRKPNDKIHDYIASQTCGIGNGCNKPVGLMASYLFYWHYFTFSRENPAFAPSQYRNAPILLYVRKHSYQIAVWIVNRKANFLNHDSWIISNRKIHKHNKWYHKYVF